MSGLRGTFLPFLYPCLENSPLHLRQAFRSRLLQSSTARRVSQVSHPIEQAVDLPPASARLDPPPEDYARTIFADKCTLTLGAGSGGHGCISFVREKFIAFGPPNGGDGGTGGNVYIQAVRGETSLHKLARRGNLKAGRGKNGQGKGKGGQRGEDLLLQVPVGTVVREVTRYDPVAEEDERTQLDAGELEPIEGDKRGQWRKDKWILYPASLPSEYVTAEFPALPRPRKSNLTMSQLPAPVTLDLSEPTEKPILLAAGAMGGLGNPHFATKSITRPKFATRGEQGMSLTVELELKLLADVGFVGLPNAGKSTLLRALSRSRARVGDWAFTTIQPNIGTVVLDDNRGRPKMQSYDANGEPRTHFSIADIPGLIQDAHLDKGLGLGFLRHIERARVLAFVVDLSTRSAVETLKGLWRELAQFETLQDMSLNEGTQSNIVDWRAFGSSVSSAAAEDRSVSTREEHLVINASGSSPLPPLFTPPMSTKPWFVVATKADLPETQGEYAQLQTFLDQVSKGMVKHPSGKKNAWKGKLCAIPVSAINGEGVDRIAEWTISLLDE